MVNQIYPPELKLNKANTSDIEVPYLVYINIFLTFPPKFKINTMTLIFLVLDGDVQRRPSYGVNISQLIKFARVCGHINKFNIRN